jgi:hypothetical protein
VVIIGTNGYGRGLADPMQLNYLIGRHGFCSTLAGGTELSAIPICREARYLFIEE